MRGATILQQLQPWGPVSCWSSQVVLPSSCAGLLRASTGSHQAPWGSSCASYSASSCSSTGHQQLQRNCCINSTSCSNGWQHPLLLQQATAAGRRPSSVEWLQGGPALARVFSSSTAPAAADKASRRTGSSSSSSSSSSTSGSRRPTSHSQTERRIAEYDFKSVTAGILYDQYTPPVSYWSSGAYKSLSATKGFIKHKWYSYWKDWGGTSTAKTNIPGFDKELLRSEVADIYLQVNKAQAVMQPDLARDLVSRDVFTKLRAQAEQRRRQGWSRIHWELLDEDNLVKGVKQLQARTVKFFEKSSYDYIQMTFCISSKQRFAAYSAEPGTRQEQLVAGDPEEVLDVTEYCVFERKTRSVGRFDGILKNQQVPLEGSRWRLVAWLEP